MGYRKLISFGDTSYVVSLPKDWVEKNGLKKGDFISVDEEEDSLIKIAPINLKPKQMDNDFLIDFNGNLKDLKTRILYAYVNNFKNIVIKKQNISEFTKGVRDVISNFIGLNVLEQKDDKIIVTDLLDISSISVFNDLRRIDRLILSMAEDIKNMLQKKEVSQEEIIQKDEDINKLTNLIFKVIRRSQNKSDMIILKLTMNDVFYYWDLVRDLEEIGDQIKRIGREVDQKTPKEVIGLFNTCIEAYTNAMNSNYKKNRDLAVEVLINRKNFFNECEAVEDKLNRRLDYSVIERIKIIHNLSGNLALTFLKLS